MLSTVINWVSFPHKRKSSV